MVRRGANIGSRNDAAIAKAKYLGETHGVKAVAYKVDGVCNLYRYEYGVNSANKGSLELR